MPAALPAPVVDPTPTQLNTPGNIAGSVALPAPVVDPTPTQPDADPIIDLAPPPPPVDDVPAAQPQQDARQDVPAVEPALAPSSPSIDAHAQRQAFLTQALVDLADMPEVSRMICCQHNGIGVPACDACASRAAAFVPPSHEEALELERQVISAANAPVEPGRDERKPAARKRRGKPS